MKQIISFKKELPFKTKVSDITSISLERDINVEDDGIVTGMFHITGDYKMNEGSINREEFSFELPFDITLDPRYDTKTVKADIEDFYYDIMNNDTLKVNIDLFIEAEYLPEPIKEDIKEIEEISEVREKPEIVDILSVSDKENNKEAEKEIGNEPQFEEVTVEELPREEDDGDEIGTDLFSNLDDTETYVTYYVYIVKEDDNIDKILNKYGITKEELEDYNDITNIKVGDKLIIPKCNEK